MIGREIWGSRTAGSVKYDSLNEEGERRKMGLAERNSHPLRLSE